MPLSIMYLDVYVCKQFITHCGYVSLHNLFHCREVLYLIAVGGHPGTEHVSAVAHDALIGAVLVLPLAIGDRGVGAALADA